MGPLPNVLYGGEEEKRRGGFGDVKGNSALALWPLVLLPEAEKRINGKMGNTINLAVFARARRW